MDRFLIGAALVLLVFGMLLLFWPGVLKKISDFLNKSVFPVEDKMRAANIVSGVILVILSVVVFYLASKK